MWLSFAVSAKSGNISTPLFKVDYRLPYVCLFLQRHTCITEYEWISLHDAPQCHSVLYKSVKYHSVIPGLIRWTLHIHSQLDILSLCWTLPSFLAAQQYISSFIVANYFGDMSGSSSHTKDEHVERRSRASKGKSRSGCVACKERRIKVRINDRLRFSTV